MDLFKNQSLEHSHTSFSPIRSTREVSHPNSDDSDINLSRDITEIIGDVDEDISDENYRQIGRRIGDLTIVILNAVQKDVSTVNQLFLGMIQAVFKSVILCATALGLGAYPARSTGELWPPFVWKTFGPENSIHFTDPYSFLHFESGLLSYLLWGWWGNPGTPVQFEGPIMTTLWQDYGGLILGLAVAFLWEVLENSDYIINLYNRDLRSAFYKGDSAINIFGDILSLGVAYNIAKIFGSLGLYWVPAVWFVMSEVFCALTFRDSLLLSIIATVAPQDFISKWQNELIPDHLKGVMSTGYWENKVRDPPEVFLDKLVNRDPSMSLKSFQRFTHNQFKVSQRFWKNMGTIMEKRHRI